MLPKFAVGDKCIWRDHFGAVVALEAGRSVIKIDDEETLRSVPLSELKVPKETKGYEEHLVLKIDQTAWDKGKRLAEAFTKILDCPRGRSAAIDALAKTEGLSARQTWRLFKRFEENPTVTSLCPAGVGRRRGVRVLDLEREAIIEKCIDEYYLKPERPSLAALHSHIQTVCREKGIDAPCAKAVAARVKARDTHTVVSRREGREQAEATCVGVPGHVAVTQPLERVEIDHTLVDVILRANTPKREVIGRPWLTLAVDCYSRMVLGYHLSFERPSAASVALCLAMAAQPKDDMLREMQIAARWPACGTPKQIWVDNALEFRSEALRRGCEQSGIALCFRPVGYPQVGGTIERLIGTLMGAVHLLPGTTQSNVQEKGDYDSEARAVMTLAEFTAWFTEQVATGYHLKKHRGLGMTPLDAWLKAMGEKVPSMPRDRLEFYARFLPAESRILGRTGVSLNCIGYWADPFGAWIGKAERVLVHYHPGDLGQVYVRLPDGPVVVAKADRAEVQGLSLADWKLRKSLRAVGQPCLTTQRDQGARRNEQRVKEAQTAMKRAMRLAVGATDAEHEKPTRIIPAAPRPTGPTLVLVSD